MMRIGLTGSIAMGKSTVAAMFVEEGARLWDADAAVRRLYREGGAGARAIEALAPAAICDGAVQRDRLRILIGADATLLPKIEAAIHPLVAQDRAAFLAQAEAEGAAMALCDIPLLFETGSEAEFDAVVVVSAPAATQRARALARPGMTEAHLDAILARQLPDAEKRARATHIVDTGGSLDETRAQVAALAAQYRRGG